MTVPYLWTVYVQLRWQDGSIPTNQQISQVLAFESYGDSMQDLCAAGMNVNGICTLNFGSEKFYPPRTNPTLTIKVFNCQGVLLHTQEFADVVNNSTLSIVINGTVNNNWRVSGTVKNSLGAPVTTGTVKAFDVYYSPERMLGQQTISASGSYIIEYTSDTFGKSLAHPAPNLVLRAYDTSNSIIAEAARSTPSQDETVDLVVSELSEQWRISGFVKLDEVALVAGTVWLFDTFEGTEYPLGSVLINEHGYYLVNYLESQFQHGTPRAYPELSVKVYGQSDDFLGSFSVPSPPSENQVFNINIETMQSVPVNWQISGIVKRSDESSLGNGIVQVYDIFDDNEYILGSCTLNVTGTYLVCYTSSQFQHGSAVRNSPVLKVKIFNTSGQLLQESDVPSPLQVNQLFNITLPVVQSNYNVSGVLRNGNTYPLSDLSVHLECLFMAEGKLEKMRLGSATTTPKGTYSITYNPAEIPGLISIDKLSIYILVEKTEDEVTEEIAKSSLYTNPDELLVHDFTIDLPSESDTSELSDFFEDLESHGFTDDVLAEIAYSQEKLEYASSVSGRSKEEIKKVAVAGSLRNELQEALEETSVVLNNITTEVMYALTSMGAVSTYRDLLILPAKRMHTILVSAISKNMVSPAIQDRLTDIITEWEDVSGALLAKEDKLTGGGTLITMAAFEDTDVNNCIRSYYAKYSHSLNDFWNELDREKKRSGSPITDDHINKLKFMFDIYQFADQFEPLVERIVGYVEGSEYESLDDLVRLSKETWQNITLSIRNFEYEEEIIEWPEFVPGESDREKRLNYATILFRKIIAMFGMERFRFELNEAYPGEVRWDGWENVKEFLDTHSEFDFAEAIDAEEVLSFISGTPEQKTVFYAKMTMIQRLYRLTPRFKSIDGLLAEGFKSAMSIAHMSADDFIKRYSNAVGGVDDAHTLHMAAVHTASQTLFLMGTFNQQSDMQDESLPVITEKISALAATNDKTDIGPLAAPRLSTGNADVMDAAPEKKAMRLDDGSATAMKAVSPDIVTLFGNQNQCTCEQCQSVFSPSAYMVDLLEFTNDAVRSELFARRPDLAYTDLSCRNTNGPVPIIDLAIEVLEELVCSKSFYITDEDGEDFNSFIHSDWKKGNVPVPSTVSKAFAARGFILDNTCYRQPIEEVEGATSWDFINGSWRYVVKNIPKDGHENGIFLVTPYPQTGSDAQSRRVTPEHLNRDAYKLLKLQSYPSILPFNLPFEEVNAFLKMSSSSRHALLMALEYGPDQIVKDENEGLIKAYFELNDRQWSIMSTPNPANPWKLWGLSQEDTVTLAGGFEMTGTWIELLSNVAIFLNRSALTFDQLLDLLSTYTINGGRSGATLYLDWDKDNEEDKSVYENAEIEKFWIRNADGVDFTKIVRLSRLCSALGIDIITADRLLAMSKNNQQLENMEQLYLYYRIADEFSVTPLNAASWLTCNIDNVNMRRGGPCQLEKLFISKMKDPDRASLWNTMINDFETPDIRNFVTMGEDNRYGADINVLLSGLNIGYNDLSLIVYKEFGNEASNPDAAAILPRVPVTTVNLGKMFRVADFSKALGVTVSDFYLIKDIVSAHSSVTYFSTEFMFHCRDVLKKASLFGISLKEMDYLVNGTNEGNISWLPEDSVEPGMLLKIHGEAMALRNSSNTGNELNDAIKEKVIGELSALCGISDDAGEVLLDSVLKSRAEISKSVLDNWVEICHGGWNALYLTEPPEDDEIDESDFQTVSSVNIVAGSKIGEQKLPAGTRFAQWTSNLFVNENGTYEITGNIWAKNKDVVRVHGTLKISVSGLNESGIWEELDIKNLMLVRGNTYRIAVTWNAPDGVGEPPIWELVNIGCLWRNKDAADSIATLIKEENTIRSLAADLDKVVNGSFLIKQLRITAQQLTDLNSMRSVQGTINFNALAAGISGGFFNFMLLLDVFELNRKLPFKQKDSDMFKIWKKAQTNPFNMSAFQKFVAQEIDWPLSCLTTQMTGRSLEQIDCRRIPMWRILNAAFKELKKTSISAAFGKTLVFNNDNTAEQSSALTNALSARFTPSQWVETAEPVRDKLRIRQRDALCAYMFTRRMGVDDSDGLEIISTLLDHKTGINPDTIDDRIEYLQWLNNITETGTMDDATWAILDSRTGFTDTAALYGKYLIDIDMQPSVKTTRIVQANCSIQMFIQRIMLGFEYNLEVTDKIKHQWPWMKNYRLWEANRKIFLYPENWLEPEFRDDKTTLFKELEDNLLQKELSSGSIETIFKSYASGLSDVANLEIIGSFEAESQGEKVLHVVGRSYHSPHSYYYRRNHDRITGGPSFWTPWEKVDLDINSDVVIPVPFRNRIYLFWPIIERKEKVVEKEEGSETSSDKDKKSSENENPYESSVKYFELKLAWSEYSEGKWSPKRISQNTLLHTIDNIDHETVKPYDLFHFKAEISGGQVQILVFAFNKVIEKIKVKTILMRTIVFKIFCIKKKKVLLKELINIFTRERESISKIAMFSFGAANSASLEVQQFDQVAENDSSENMLNSATIPSGGTMRHNRAEIAPEDSSIDQPGVLEYPRGNPILRQTPGNYICFPTNLSFFDQSYRPFIYQQREKSLFFKPVPSPEELAQTDNRLEKNGRLYFKVSNFYHPLADDIMSLTSQGAVDSLFCRPTQAGSKENYPLGYASVGDDLARHLGNLSFNYQYLPSPMILGDYPMAANDFSLTSPYGIYNWELFFHLPLYIASRLSADNQFEEAMRWFHFVFNPGGDFTTWEKTQAWLPTLPPGSRYWNFLPFFGNKGVRDSIYKAIEKSQIENEDTALGSLIEDWKNNPFKPHLIARIRMAAYQKSVVMKYLDNLINWGDGLFRLDNMESVNEATQLYVYASQILGKKPFQMPQLHDMPGLTYTQLKAEGLDKFSNAIIQLENYIPPPPPIKVRFWRARNAPSRYYYYHYYYYSYNQSVESVPHRSIQLLRMAPTLHYFCIPRNDRLLSYWNVVEDRLFKIRNSLNIDGVKRELPLFAPPLDPGMLARATAQGISIGALLRDLQTSPSVYRYSTVYQKAIELCNELKSFGSLLLSALEKKDGESLAILRTTHELNLLNMITKIKEKAVEEASEALEALNKSREVINERYKFYKDVKEYSQLEKAQLTTMATATALNWVGQAMVLGSSPIKLIPDIFGGALVGLTGGAIGLGFLTGGTKASDSMESAGKAIIESAGIFDRMANVLGTNASYKRRWDEWKLQERLAEKEIAQIDKQILGAKIRIKLTELELENHLKQIEQNEEVREVMESKFTNTDLYRWMSDELSKTYSLMYDLAYSMAKKAEKAYRFELGIQSSSFITPELWDSRRKGLLAGERLSLQLHQLDNAYLENHRREYEITKTVSLRLLDPVQLLELKENGNCQITIPEELYDYDYPGQYLRRIKSVRCSIPCISGPYTSINAKLQLVSSKVRTTTELINGSYVETEDDTRFMVNPVTPMAIATSNAQMDAGVFELNFGDSRYLPFEGAGAVSSWSIELPSECRQFDYDTITDVVLHISYTARDASTAQFKPAVISHLVKCLSELRNIPHLVSLKNSFPAALTSIVSGSEAVITFTEKHLPYLIVDFIRKANPAMVMRDVQVIVKLRDEEGAVNDLEVTLNEESGVGTGDEGIYRKFSFAGHNGHEGLPLGNWNFDLSIPDDVNVEDVFLTFNYPSKQNEESGENAEISYNSEDADHSLLMT